eukprot:6202968-Amphidinium_carterae.3
MPAREFLLEVNHLLLQIPALAILGRTRIGRRSLGDAGSSSFGMSAVQERKSSGGHIRVCSTTLRISASSCQASSGSKRKSAMHQLS